MNRQYKPVSWMKPAFFHSVQNKKTLCKYTESLSLFSFK